MQVEVKISGADGLLRTLQALPAEIVSKRGGPVKLALAKGARLICDQAIQNVKTVTAGSDESTGLLAKSIIASRGKAPIGSKGERALVRVKRRAYDQQKLGKRQKAGKRVTTHKTASLLEYGSTHQTATPWLRPAVKEKGTEAINVIVSDLDRRIQKVVRDLARKNK